MTDADIVREALRRIHCVDDHGYVYEGVDTGALAALDRLVAERDEALAKADRLTSRGIEDLRFSLEAAEAEVARLRECVQVLEDDHEGENRELRLREALEKWVSVSPHHRGECRFLTVGADDCTCGLQAARDMTRAALGKEQT